MASGADHVLEDRGAFQGTPSDERWQGHKGLHYEKPQGHHHKGDNHSGSKTGEGAGNDCDAICSAMEQGMEALGKP